MARPESLGTDLRLLDDLTLQQFRDRGSDLATTERMVDLEDLEPLHGVGNLQQALLLRFLTPVGELELLGHPRYGSRLHELIGEPNTETNRNRAKMYVLQALADEPRVKEVREVTVKTSAADRNRVEIEVNLVTLDDDTPLNLIFPFFLEGRTTP